MEDIFCPICGVKSQPATPIYLMCHKCYNLFNAATSDKVSSSGHPANQTYYHSKNTEAIEIWFNHLKANGFIKKHGKWQKATPTLPSALKVDNSQKELKE